MRIGTGYDVHRLVEGRKLYIGGIDIPAEKGALGHSDADVLIHVICDALLGAVNKRDIGFHFPDTDPKYKNIDSSILLKNVINIIREEGYEINNIDSTICLQQPKIKDYIEPIKINLARIMAISVNQISVKATTTEKLGFVGLQQGLSAYAIILLVKK